MVKTLSGYGLEYEKRISEAKAREMLKPYPLPKMGRETVQKSVPQTEIKLDFALLKSNT